MSYFRMQKTKFPEPEKLLSECGARKYFMGPTVWTLLNPASCSCVWRRTCRVCARA